MTLLLLPFSSERTCVGMHVCGAMCWSWGKSIQLFLRTKETHGFICYNNSLATVDSSSLKSLFQSCYTSLPLLNSSLVFPSRAGFQTCGPLYCATVGFTQVSLLCPFMLWPLAALICGTCSSFSFFLPSFPLVFIPCTFSLLYSSPKSQFGLKTQPCNFWCLVSLLLRFQVPC